MVSQQQKVKKAQQGNSTNELQATPSARTAPVEVRSDDAEQVQHVEATRNREETPTMLSVPDDTVASTSMNAIEVTTHGEIVPATDNQAVPDGPSKRRRKKKYREMLVDASEVMPRPSIWPLVLAFSIAVLLFGLIWNAVILFIGVALIVASIIGWSLEKREHTFKTAVPVKKSEVHDSEEPKVPAGSVNNTKTE